MDTNACPIFSDLSNQMSPAKSKRSILSGYLDPVDPLSLARTCQKFNDYVKEETSFVGARTNQRLKDAVDRKLRVGARRGYEEGKGFRRYNRSRVSACAQASWDTRDETLSWIEDFITPIDYPPAEQVFTKVFGKKTTTDGLSAISPDILLKVIGYLGIHNYTALAQTSSFFRHFFQTKAASICNGVINLNYKAIAENLECKHFQKFLVPTHPIIQVAENYFLRKMKYCGKNCTGNNQIRGSLKAVVGKDSCDGHLAYHLSQPGPQFLLFLEKYGPFLDDLLKGDLSKGNLDYYRMKRLMELFSVFYQDMEQGESNRQKLMKNLSWFYPSQVLTGVGQKGGVAADEIEPQAFFNNWQHDFLKKFGKGIL